MTKKYLCEKCGERKARSGFPRTSLYICLDCQPEKPIDNSILERPDYYVYFFYAEEVDRIKIGATGNIAKRLKGISGQSACEVRLLGYVHSNQHSEYEVHQMFDQYKHHGEWFEASPEIWEYIEREFLAVV